MKRVLFGICCAAIALVAALYVWPLETMVALSDLTVVLLSVK